MKLKWVERWEGIGVGERERLWLKYIIGKFSKKNPTILKTYKILKELIKTMSELQNKFPEETTRGSHLRTATCFTPLNPG